MACRVCDKNSRVRWDVFTPKIMASAMGVPPDVAEEYARTAVIEFAQRTMLFQRDIYIDTQDSVADYEVEVDDDYVIKSIRQVCVGGEELQPISKPACCNNWQRGYYFEKPCSIIVSPVPQCDMREGLLVRAVVAPGHNSCTIDEWVYNEYAETIVAGALSHILLMKNSSWYDTQAGGVYAKRWMTFISRAKVDRIRNSGAGPLRFKIPRWL